MVRRQSTIFGPLRKLGGTISTDGVKIIMTTAVADVKSVVKSFMRLCDAYLIKPIDRAKLLDHIKALHLV